MEIFCTYIRGKDYRTRELYGGRFSVDKDGLSIFVGQFDECVQRIKDIDYNSFLIHGSSHRRYLDKMLKKAIYR